MGQSNISMGASQIYGRESNIRTWRFAAEKVTAAGEHVGEGGDC